jgi:iron-sulfur cluster repair protein YtfE (RIC family)
MSGSAFSVVPTPDPGVRLAPEPSWDESERPTGPAPDPRQTYGPRALASGQHLVDIHDHLRSELRQVRELVEQVLDGSADAGSTRSRINEMTMRQNSWTLGAYCAAYCRVLTTHHTIEDQSMFPRLRAGDPRLGPVVDRLEYEHGIIHHVLERVDAALVTFVGPASDSHSLQQAVDELTDALLSHLAYEERELVEPIARLGVLV